MLSTYTREHTWILSVYNFSFAKNKGCPHLQLFLHGISTMLKSTKTAVPESIKHGEQSCMYPLKITNSVKTKVQAKHWQNFTISKF